MADGVKTTKGPARPKTIVADAPENINLSKADFVEKRRLEKEKAARISAEAEKFDAEHDDVMNRGKKKAKRPAKVK